MQNAAAHIPNSPLDPLYLKRKLWWCLAIFLFSLSAYTALAQVPTPAPSTQVQINQKTDAITELEQQIARYEEEITNRRTRQRTLSNEIALLNAKIKKAQLEIQRFILLIRELSGEIAKREAAITEAEKDIVRRQGIIALELRSLAQEEDVPTLLLFAAGGRFSNFFSQLQGLDDLHDRLRTELEKVQAQKTDLEAQRQQLAERREENENLKDIQVATEEQLTKDAKQRKDLLVRTKGEEKKFQELVKLSKTGIEKLKNEIYYLQRIGVTAEQAASFGVLVANRIGIRPAFLIAILEIESRLGANVGKGTWTIDMHPSQQEAFAQICRELGLDPNQTPVSKKPSYGWGGAMGPAQFLPNTWLAYKDRVVFYSGHALPSPWNIEDAFFAAALKLAAGGASGKTTDGELAAARAYISGSALCSKSICNYYANLAIDKAADIERSLQ